MDLEGVKLAVRVFIDNDYYYPCPNKYDASRLQLWTHFRSRYLAMSQTILPKTLHNLPKIFIQRVFDELSATRPPRRVQNSDGETDEDSEDDSFGGEDSQF
jgi:hypothetical protein